MKNIGLCFYGESREWKVGADTVKLFKSLPSTEFNTDVFIHTWDNLSRRINHGQIHQLIRKLQKEQQGDIEVALKRICLKEQNLKHVELIDYYKPKKIKIDSKNIINENLEAHNAMDLALEIKYSNVPGFCQFYSTYRSFNLLNEYCIENDKKYDIIFIIRTDCNLSPIDINKKNINFYINYLKRHEESWAPGIVLLDRVVYVRKYGTAFFHATLISNTCGFTEVYKNFNKSDLFMGKRLQEKQERGNTHIEWRKYIEQYTDINRVYGINTAMKQAYLTPKYKQYDNENVII